MIYMDNAATSPIEAEVLDAMLPYLKEEYGNPSSKYYCCANNAKNAVEDARCSLPRKTQKTDKQNTKNPPGQAAPWRIKIIFKRLYKAI